MFIGKFDRAILITLLGTLSVMIGSYFALVEGNITVSIICLVIAGITDMFDGKVARSIKGRTEMDKEYGIQIDSLADTVAFVFYPLVIFYGYILKNNIDVNGVLLVMIGTIFIACGITRLAFFNLKAGEVDGPVKFYCGLPVTSTAIGFPFIYLFKSLMSVKAFAYVYALLLLLIAFLFILNFKLKKPKGKWFYIVMPIIAIIGVTVLIIL
jgi:CDP-diacylglycerol--serine O-phosphatidyltransferase